MTWKLFATSSLLLSLLGVGAGVGGPIRLSELENPPQVIVAKLGPSWSIPEGTDPKIAQVIRGLIQCESGGNEQAIGDSGRARGILQFWKSTFIYYAKKYNQFPYAEDAEIENFWLDSQSQIDLAIKILNEPGGFLNWYNCSKLHNY